MGNRAPVSPADSRTHTPTKPTSSSIKHTPPDSEPAVINPLVTTHPNTAAALREQMLLALIQEKNTVPQIYDLVKEHGRPINILPPIDKYIQSIDLIANNKKTVWDIYNGQIHHLPVREITKQLMVWDNRVAFITIHPITGEPYVFYVHIRHLPPTTYSPHSSI